MTKIECYWIVINLHSMHELVIHIYSGTFVLWTLWDQKKCPDYQGVLIFQVSLPDKVPFGTTTKCVDYVGVPIFKCPD